jgi:hypothetical protein
MTAWTESVEWCPGTSVRFSRDIFKGVHAIISDGRLEETRRTGFTTGILGVCMCLMEGGGREGEGGGIER